MNMDTWIALAGLIVGLIIASLGAVVWFVRLEGRVNTTIALQAQFKEWVEKEHSSIATGLKEVKDSIERLFDKLDRKADK